MAKCQYCESEKNVATWKGVNGGTMHICQMCLTNPNVKLASDQKALEDTVRKIVREELEKIRTEESQA